MLRWLLALGEFTPDIQIAFRCFRGAPLSLPCDDRLDERSNTYPSRVVSLSDFRGKWRPCPVSTSRHFRPPCRRHSHLSHAPPPSPWTFRREASPTVLTPHTWLPKMLSMPPRRTALSRRENGTNGSGPELTPQRRRGHKGSSRSHSRRRKRFQKLLWVKQSCKDPLLRAARRLLLCPPFDSFVPPFVRG